MQVSDRRLWEELQGKEDIINRTNKRIEVTNTKVQRMRDRLQRAHQPVEEMQQRISHTLQTHKEEFDKLYNYYKTLKLHFEWQERLIEDLNRQLKVQ